MALLNADGTETNGTNGPWWAKTIWTLGPLAVIALGLVYLLAFDVRSEARTAALVTVEVQKELKAHHEHTEALHRNIERYMQVQTLLTRQLCANVAKNAAALDACFR